MTYQEILRAAHKRMLDYKSIHYLLNSPESMELISKAEREEIEDLLTAILAGEKRKVSEWLAKNGDPYEAKTVQELRMMAYRIGIPAVYKIPGKQRLIQAIKDAIDKDPNRKVP